MNNNTRLLLRSTKLRICSIKRQSIKALSALIKPHLHRSGYVDGKRSLLFTIIKPAINTRSYLSIDRVTDGIIGFTEGDYIITDGYAGHLVTVAMSEMCIEDLIRLRSRVERFTANRFH